MHQEIDIVLRDSPRLKAREIAKLIDGDRSAVSKFLHDNSDKYEQNEKYEWKLRRDSQYTISLYDNWMTGGALEEVLSKYGDLFGDAVEEVELIFPGNCKPLMEALARLLSLVNQLAHAGKKVTIDVTQAVSTKGYLDRTGFFDLLNPAIGVNPKRPATSAALRYKGNSGNLIEFGPVYLKGNNSPLIEALTNAFVALSSAEYRTAAVTVFGELIGNIKLHSQSPLHGFAGLQHYPGGRHPHIQTVVSDSGLGIAGTLRPVLQKLHPQLFERFKGGTIGDDAGLVEEVLRQGRISRVNRPGRGLGLKASQVQASKFNALLTLRQERFSLQLQYSGGELTTVVPTLNLQKLLGTHICFDFYL